MYEIVEYGNIFNERDVNNVLLSCSEKKNGGLLSFAFKCGT